MATSPAEASILVVEDDAIVREIITAYLGSYSLRVVAAADCAAARALASTVAFDLALVDVNLPDGTGFDLADDLRHRRDCGIIYITSLGAAEHKVHGLERGGDDYIVKPVEVRELLARVRAVLRRYRRPDIPARRLEMTVIGVAGWTIDLVRREIADPASGLVRLTRAEFDLLAALVQAGGTPLGRDYLREVVGSVDSDPNSRTIDVMVSRIRRKLASAAPPLPRIETCKGEGYRFVAPS